MFIGGHLIKRFDGFRRLCRHAASEFGHQLHLPDPDLLLANRVLAALGGPPAKPEVRGRFEGDGLALLVLFLLTQEIPCRVGIVGGTEGLLSRLKGLVHLFGHAVYPLLSGEAQLSFQEVVRELGPNGAVLKPLLRYDDDGEPIHIEVSGAVGALRTGSEGGPYTLAVLHGNGSGPAPLESAGGGMHATVLILGE